MNNPGSYQREDTVTFFVEPHVFAVFHFEGPGVLQSMEAPSAFPAGYFLLEISQDDDLILVLGVTCKRVVDGRGQCDVGEFSNNLGERLVSASEQTVRLETTACVGRPAQSCSCGTGIKTEVQNLNFGMAERTSGPRCRWNFEAGCVDRRDPVGVEETG